LAAVAAVAEHWLRRMGNEKNKQQNDNIKKDKIVIITLGC
jgi:hypothetical protein